MVGAQLMVYNTIKRKKKPQLSGNTISRKEVIAIRKVPVNYRLSETVLQWIAKKAKESQINKTAFIETLIMSAMQKDKNY